MQIQLVSVVLPVYNQADHIQGVLQEYLDALKTFHVAYELLPVVNGRRRDDSLRICQAMQEKHACIRTLCIEEGGWGRAVRHGLSQARGELLCYTNSARTTAKELLLALIYGTVHSGSVIKANRKIRESAVRRFGSLLYNLECRALFDLPYWDVNGTPKVFSRDLTRLLNLRRNDDLIDLEFNAICRQEEYPVVEIPVFSTSRRSGASTTTLRSAFHMYWNAYRFRRESQGK
jgi:glycosyltransferase involved in cell wall biosynthesis